MQLCVAQTFVQKHIGITPSDEAMIVLSYTVLFKRYVPDKCFETFHGTQLFCTKKKIRQTFSSMKNEVYLSDFN